MSAEIPDWSQDESICPCGEKAGPEFRYGLCDKHANETPAPALLRMGVTMGRHLKQEEEMRAALAAANARADANLLALDVAAQNAAREKARADAADGHSNELLRRAVNAERALAAARREVEAADERRASWAEGYQRLHYGHVKAMKRIGELETALRGLLDNLHTTGYADALTQARTTLTQGI